MSYAYIPRTSKCQGKINFFSLTSRSQETFAVFHRLYRDIEIRNQGALKREIKRSRPNKNSPVTRGSSEAGGIEKGLNRSLRFWFGGRSDAISRRSATLAGACFSFNPPLILVAFDFQMQPRT